MRLAIEPCVSPSLFERERPMPGFQFTLRLIVMRLNLVSELVFRGAAEAMQIIFAGLDMDMKFLLTMQSSSGRSGSEWGY